MAEDYYELLGVDRNATSDEIKKAYRKKAMKFHPDQNPDDEKAEEMFKKVSEAYSTLSDPDEKAYYDRVGSTRGAGGRNRGPSVEDHFRDFFSHNPFGGGMHQQIMIDIKVSTRISFKDSVLGTQTNIKFHRNLVCETCKGQAVEISEETCTECHGKGYHEQIQRSFGNIVIRTNCNSCHGTGKKCKPCKDCSGQGHSKKACTIKVEIPPRIQPLSQIIAKDMGNTAYINGKKHTGCAYIVIDFPRQEGGVMLKNGNLHLTVNVPIDKSLGNDEIIVDILGFKEVKLKLDHQKESGHVYSVQNEDKSGFYFIKVLLDVPKNNISEEDREKLINTFREIYGTSTEKIKPVPTSTTNT